MRNLAKIIEKDAFLKEQSTVLLACSGGMDSMCLAHLLLEANVSFQIAHINYKLRGLDADLDQQLVVTWAWSHGIPVWTKTIDLSVKKGNIQSIAREERYQWFKALVQKYRFSRIITAHHADDLIEGSLLKWMRGIPWEDRYLIPQSTIEVYRPLLNVSKEDIQTWTTKKKIPYRTDTSNLDDTKYDRNFIRLNFLAPLKKRRIGIIEGMIEKAYEEESSRRLFHWMMDQLSEPILQETRKGWILDLAAFMRLNPPEMGTFLKHMLKRKGCPGNLSTQILQASTGAMWTCQTGILLLDRQHLIFENTSINPDNEIQIVSDGIYTSEDGQSLEFMTTNKPDLSTLGENELFLDGGSYYYPFIWKIWQPGDRITPFGMQGKHKKVQDIFTDKKIDRLRKQKIRLLFKDETLLWIPGLKKSELTRCTKDTSEGILIKYRVQIGDHA